MQTTRNTCGQACVAMLAGVTVADAVELMDGYAGKTAYRELTRALKRAGRAPGRDYRRWRPHRSMSALALVRFRLRVDNRVSHWMVWDGRRRRFLDPDPAASRPEFGPDEVGCNEWRPTTFMEIG